MAKTLAEKRAAAKEVSGKASLDLLNQLVGSERKYRATNAKKAFAKPGTADIMIFGEIGTGKTYLIIHLLKAGLKVFGIMTDFGKNGFDTIRNYFKTHPEDAHLEENFAYFICPDANALMDFVRDPKCVEVEMLDGTVGTLYDFDPNVLFWDGCSAYQQVDLEAMIFPGNEFLRGDNTFKNWQQAQNGTLFPLMQFLALVSTSGKPWSKVVTFLKDKKFESEKTGEVDSKGAPKTRMVFGTNKEGPLLHTGARKLAGAGFSLCLEATKTELGDETKYYFVSRDNEKLVKNRGFVLPAEVEVTDATKNNFWVKYILPNIKGTETKSAVPTSTLVNEENK